MSRRVRLCPFFLNANGIQYSPFRARAAHSGTTKLGRRTFEMDWLLASHVVEARGNVAGLPLVRQPSSAEDDDDQAPQQPHESSLRIADEHVPE